MLGLQRNKIHEWRPRVNSPVCSRAGRRLRPAVIGLEDRLLLATGGSLDPSFGANGVRRIDFKPGGVTSPYSAGNAIFVDDRGNIVTSGFATPSYDVNATVGISGTVGRLTNAGAPDPAFHGEGQANGSILLDAGDAIPQFAQPWELEYNSLIPVRGVPAGISGNHANDLILIGEHKDAYYYEDEITSEMLLMRLTPSGGLYRKDRSFGFGGEAFIAYTDDPPTGYYHYVHTANAAVLQVNGTILVSGSLSPSVGSIPLVRLTFDGWPDQTFGQGGNLPGDGPPLPSGTELLDVPNVDCQSIQAMAFQGADKILLAGTCSNGLLLVRLNAADDSLDTSFGSDGSGSVVFSAIGGAKSMAIDPTSGRIVVACDSGIAAFTASGIRDLNFGINGIVSTAIANGIALQPDGKIVVCGSAVDSNNHHVAALARYTAAGAVDTTFSPSGTGLVTTDVLNGGESSYNGIAVQSDGKIVVTGVAKDPLADVSTTVVARYVGETPELAGLNPSSVKEHSPSFTLTVTGDNFQSASKALWNNKALATTYVDAHTLTAAVQAGNLEVAGTVRITVLNPGNVSSSVQIFTVVSTKVAPKITWQGPAPIRFGIKLSASQLNATASASGFPVAGHFEYTPALGTVLHAGLAQQLSVTFTPDDTQKYTPASATVKIDVLKATPAVIWFSPADIIIGTPLSSSQLNATAYIAGTLSYMPPVGTVLGLGVGQVLSVRFVPANTSDYESTSAQVLINVLAPPRPHVARIIAGSHTKKGLASIKVLFDESMSAGSVKNRSYYTVFGAVTKKKKTTFTKLVPIRSVSYDDGTHTANITFSKPFKGVVQTTVKSGIAAANGMTLSQPFVAKTQ